MLKDNPLKWSDPLGLAYPIPERFPNGFPGKSCVCTNMKSKRDDISKNPNADWFDPNKADDWGHYWTEIGNVSYGWWPNDRLDDISGVLGGVPGSLNGADGMYFGGTRTRDPKHGDPTSSTTNPTASGPAAK